ncbi:MAG: radical SAM protein [Smithella sp.]|nr:radical SAM protein [Smithella sp.]HOU51334.1 radical SAM protein [Smithella sp.]HQG66142.1 radical SAM protein [Smithella sp.]HQI73339.1 radical SAM protein [Smithella sp.]
MSNEACKYIYGPVPSRRLGRSLGVDLVPFKTCTYDCIYCQLGQTTNKTIQRRDYVAIDDVMKELKDKLDSGMICDYISLAGSGEPTLHSGIGDLIEKIKTMTNIPVAVITNGSLLYLPEVREALMCADLVLPSLDVGDEQLFQYVNRPHSDLSLDQMVKGLIDFSKIFTGQIWLEVLLLGGVTGIQSEVEKIASIVKFIHPAKVQLNTVYRPPAEETAFPLTVEQLIALKSIFSAEVDIIDRSKQIETPIPEQPTVTDGDIIALLARRPCTIVDIASGLGMHVNEVMKRMEKLVEADKVNCIVTRKRNYYTKRY